MTLNGWTCHGPSQDSTLWRYIKSGRPFRLPNRPRNIDQCWAEVRMYSFDHC